MERRTAFIVVPPSSKGRRNKSTPLYKKKERRGGLQKENPRGVRKGKRKKTLSLERKGGGKKGDNRKLEEGKKRAMGLLIMKGQCLFGEEEKGRRRIWKSGEDRSNAPVRERWGGTWRVDSLAHPEKEGGKKGRGKKQ